MTLAIRESRANKIEAELYQHDDYARDTLTNQAVRDAKKEQDARYDCLPADISSADLDALLPWLKAIYERRFWASLWLQLREQGGAA